jgi:hypothetical protein
VPFALQADSLAGYLLPDTYRVPAPDGELAVDRLIQTQLDAFWKRFAEPRADAIAASGRSLHQIVIMASLLEREEPKPEVRPKVAGVLYKRLDSNTPLERPPGLPAPAARPRRPLQHPPAPRLTARSDRRAQPGLAGGRPAAREEPLLVLPAR